jgi:hypothetical protein
MHPNLKTLLAYGDQQLSLRRGTRIECHLRNCARCRGKLRLATLEIEQFVALEAGQLHQEPNPDAIMAVIRRSKASKRPAIAAPSQLHTQITRELDAYLGGRAAALAEQLPHASSGDQGLLSAAEQLFSAFLGREAASALVGQILDGLALERSVVSEQPA